MPCSFRKFMRIIKLLLAGGTLFFISWVVSVNEWHGGVRWEGPRAQGPTMRTIVAYSEGKQAEMDRPSPVTCDRLPAFPKIPHINRSWFPDAAERGWQQLAGTTVSLYAAYYDQRQPQRFVRILAKFQGRNISIEEPLFCQTRPLNTYEDSVEVVAAKPLEIWWHEWDVSLSKVETPLLLSCPLTEPLNGPAIVSIVTEPCNNPTNAFILESNENTFKNKKSFTICVKDMNFDNDVSQNLVEWIETNKLLGVDIIDMYIDKVEKETERILLHYREKGYVRLFQVPIKNKPERSLWQRRRDHILTYNDCLYRNIQDSEFIIPLDVDEIILPKIAKSLPELIKRLFNKGWDPTKNSAILIQNVFFFGFMQRVDKYENRKMRSKNKVYVKRDDVRIKKDENLDVSEIELIHESSSISNEVIDIRDLDEDLYDKYRSRCGRDLVIPKLVNNIVSSALVSPVGYYSKSLMLTRKVLTAFNHYPLVSLGASGFAGWSAPYNEVQLNHYKESCNTTVVAECERYGRRARIDRAALRLRRRLTRALADAICTGINIT
ncbi:uncharacterized protein LOC128674954 [Plodia interpunctella]|uniref:uncharacterized protein LOC128674954 n=1 Tax=Plodia interpunctella TaxID=58824 RepID=UPI0023679F96|nr:uncharacterized protein LOC128674954 [Plodia interpunctella]